MSNFKDDIIKAANGEPIESIVIGPADLWDEDPVGDPTWETKPDLRAYYDKVLDWLTAGILLDYEYDSGFGSVGCHAITAWTRNYVIFVSQYDGSTRVRRVIRNPFPHKPIIPGG